MVFGMVVSKQLQLKYKKPSISRLRFLLPPWFLAWLPANFSVNYLVDAVMVFATCQIIMLNVDLMEAIVATTLKMDGIPDAIPNGIRM